MAYYAYKRSLNNQPSPVIDGYTGEQRLFLSWAQSWRRKYREEALRERLATDSHSPGFCRAIGPVSNMPEFYEAFKVKEGDKMFRNPEIRVRIW
jgi:putative endopeptidase